MSGSDITHKKYASVAQSVEQGTENPRVGGSIPPRGTKAKDRDRAGVAQLAEQLICNQQVAGSIPVTSSNKGRFPSGQREQTVNLPTMSSVVRIHPFPPHANRRLFGACLRVVGRGGLTNHGPKRAWFGDPRSGRFREVAVNLLSKTKSGKRTSTPYTDVKATSVFLWWEGVDHRTTALKGRGSAVRRRRQLSRSCCQLTLEDDKREANLHPLTKGTR